MREGRLIQQPLILRGKTVAGEGTLVGSTFTPAFFSKYNGEPYYTTVTAILVRDFDTIGRLWEFTIDINFGGSIYFPGSFPVPDGQPLGYMWAPELNEPAAGTHGLIADMFDTNTLPLASKLHQGKITGQALSGEWTRDAGLITNRVANPQAQIGSGVDALPMSGGGVMIELVPDAWAATFPIQHDNHITFKYTSWFGNPGS